MAPSEPVLVSSRTIAEGSPVILIEKLGTNAMIGYGYAKLLIIYGSKKTKITFPS